MTCNKLRKQIEDLTNDLCELISELPIKYFNGRIGAGLVAASRHYWGERNPNQKSRQMKLKRKYDAVSELLFLMFNNAPKDLLKKLKETDKSIRAWIELGRHWSITSDKIANDKKLKKDFLQLQEIVDVLEADDNKEVILIPDTNSLLISPDPVKYETIAETSDFTFMLMPTALSELDKLKISYRNSDVQDKAKKAIKRIKGWRKQGTLTEGVKVNGTIIVRAEYREPDMENTLSWLDAENQDDRLIASVLNVQMHQPSAHIILVTGDINLQNKADPAMIEVSELEVHINE